MSRIPMNLIFPERSTAGISRDADGQRVIASSRRPDGTYRKEIKVRPGYTPQEDVALFRTSKQAELDHHRATKGSVPGLRPPANPLLAAALRGRTGAQGGDGGTTATGGAALSKAQKKNQKRKEKRHDDAVAGAAEPSDSWDADDADDAPETSRPGPATTDPLDGRPPATGADWSTSRSTPSTTIPESSTNPATDDPAKRLRALRKKLKQTQQLVEKEQAGSTLGPEEQDKVKRMSELEDEIRRLDLGQA
ncbi:hypothetical protein JCM10212_000225 [Sporobolomyces blumeae]